MGVGGRNITKLIPPGRIAGMSFVTIDMTQYDIPDSITGIYPSSLGPWNAVNANYHRINKTLTLPFEQTGQVQDQAPPLFPSASSAASRSGSFLAPQFLTFAHQ